MEQDQQEWVQEQEEAGGFAPREQVQTMSTAVQDGVVFPGAAVEAEPGEEVEVDGGVDRLITTRTALPHTGHISLTISRRLSRRWNFLETGHPFWSRNLSRSEKNLMD